MHGFSTLTDMETVAAVAALAAKAAAPCSRNLSRRATANLFASTGTQGLKRARHVFRLSGFSARPYNKSRVAPPGLPESLAEGLAAAIAADDAVAAPGPPHGD